MTHETINSLIDSDAAFSFRKAAERLEFIPDFTAENPRAGCSLAANLFTYADLLPSQLTELLEIVNRRHGDPVFSAEQINLCVAYACTEDALGRPDILRKVDDSVPPEYRFDLLPEERQDTHQAIQDALDKWNQAQTGAPVSEPSSKLFNFDIEQGKLNARFQNKPRPREWVIDGLIPSRTTGVVAGFGGSNKTRLLIQAGTCVTTGSPFFGRSCTPGAVILVLGEDDQQEIDRRIGAIVRSLGLSPEQSHLLNERLLSYSTIGEDIRLTGHRGGAIAPTGLADRIIARCKEHAKRCGVPVRLVAFDHFGLVSGGEINSNEDANVYNQQAGRIATQTGAAVLTLAHHRKSAANEERSQHSVMGAAAIVNSARLVMQLNGMTAAEAKKFGIEGDGRRQLTRLSIEKSNMTPTGDVCWLKAVLDPEYDTITLQQAALIPAVITDRKATLPALAWDAVRQFPGRFSRPRHLAMHFKGQWGLSRDAIEPVIEDMIQAGYLRRRPPSDAEREVHGHKRQVSSVLDIGGTPLPSNQFQSPVSEKDKGI